MNVYRVVTNVISRRIDVVRNLRDFTVDRFELAALVGLTLFSQGGLQIFLVKFTCLIFVQKT